MNPGGVLVWVNDALVLTGVALVGLAVYGMLSMPDLYTRLHAASKGAVVGALVIAPALMTTGDVAVIGRAVLICAALILTTPISAHVIARAAYHNREPMGSPEPLDESGRLRTEGEAERGPGEESAQGADRSRRHTARQPPP